MEAKLNQLENLMQQIGESVLVTAETVNCLAERLDALALQVQQQNQQIQQQGYQVFALSDAVQTLTENQAESLERLNQVATHLQRLLEVLEVGEPVNR